jgi:dihydrofolate reductase/thymidylate synthase
MNFDIIVAATCKRRGIGKNGKIPWKIPKDVKYFKFITTNTMFKDKYEFF